MKTRVCLKYFVNDCNNLKYDEYQHGLEPWVYKFFHEKAGYTSKNL